MGADGQTYAVAQGALALGAYTAGARGNTKQVNHPTVGRVTGGALVERDTAVSLARCPSPWSRCSAESGLRYCSRCRPSDQSCVAAGSRQRVAHVVDSRRIEISGITKDSRARCRNCWRASRSFRSGTHSSEGGHQRTNRHGSHGFRRDVGTLLILQGSLEIESSRLEVSQPQPSGTGTTQAVPNAGKSRGDTDASGATR